MDFYKTMKTCTKCKTEKDLTEFYRAVAFPDGLDYSCKACTTERNRLWRKKNRESDRIYTRNYYAKNREKFRERDRIYKRENRDKIRITERKYYWKNKEKVDARNRARFLRQYYNLPIEKYEEMYKAQNGACAICKDINTSGRKLAVDHNHNTGVIRGLLCSRCNLGIGQFKDDEDLLKIASDYIEFHKNKVSGGLP